MVYAELEASVISKLNGRDDDNTKLNIKDNTNFVIKWLATQREWEDLQESVQFNLVDGTPAYTLFDLSLERLDRVYSLMLYDGTRWQPPMNPVSKLVWNREYQPYVSQTKGRPTVFALFAQTLHLSRTPDDDYLMQIDFLAKPPKVTGAASIIPYEDLDGLFVNLVTGLTWLSLGEVDLSDRWIKMAVPMIEQFGLDSGRMLNQLGPNRQAKIGTDSWSDPFRRR